MKFERMLCAIDFSETSAAAVRTAGCLAKVLQTDLTVLHAQRWEFPLYFTAAQTQELELQLNKSDRAAQKYFEEFVTRNLPAEFPRRYRFVEGEAVSAILRTAAKIKAGVIVMGTHGRTGWNRFRLGSVMEGVLRQTAVPLFAVGPKAATADCAAPVREIFCPVNFDAISKATLEVAALLALKTGARLTVLHVLEKEPESKDARNAIEERLSEWARVHGAGQCSLHHVVRHGDPVQTVSDEARRLGSDVLVIGARPRPGLASMLFGSTTEALIRTAPCRVLVVPALDANSEQATADRKEGKD